MDKFDFTKPYNGPIYVHTIYTEVYNLKKDHEKITSSNPRKKYVDNPTAVGTRDLVTRAKDVEELKRFPHSLQMLGRKVKKSFKGDELIVPVRITKTIITNVQQR